MDKHNFRIELRIAWLKDFFKTDKVSYDKNLRNPLVYYVEFNKARYEVTMDIDFFIIDKIYKITDLD